MKKISLNSVKDYLTRDEMRIISGGSGPNCTKIACTYNSDCGSTVCAYYGPPCDAWGACKCGKYCL